MFALYKPTVLLATTCKTTAVVGLAHEDAAIIA